MPRKSDVGTESKDNTGNVTGTGGAGVGGNLKDRSFSIDDQTLPKSIVARLAKGVLPHNTNVQKDAILALSKGGTVFINYLCATANDQAKVHGRKIINPKDILEAMQIMEFDEFLPRLEAELAKFNEITSEKRATTKKAGKPKDNSVTQGPSASKHPSSGVLNNVNDSPPAPKKMRVGAGVDSEAQQAKCTGPPGNSLPVRGWGDEDEEEDEEMGEEDDELEEVEETESEEPEAEESDESFDEADTTKDPNPAEDEALDNGFDSD